MIAHSPEDIKWLVEEVKRLRAQAWNELQTAVAETSDEEFRDSLRRLEKENESLPDWAKGEPKND